MSHAEAPISLNFVLTRKDGMSVQFTLREGLQADDAVKLFGVMQHMIDTALAKGWTVPGGKATAAVQVIPMSAQAAPAAPQSEHPRIDNSALSFPVSTLGVTIDNGKTYFKAKGGRFEKFGVTVWPEVLAAAGLDVSNLPQKWAGWTAYYSVKEDGKPEKVTKLEKF